MKRVKKYINEVVTKRKTEIWVYLDKFLYLSSASMKKVILWILFLVWVLGSVVGFNYPESVKYLDKPEAPTVHPIIPKEVVNIPLPPPPIDIEIWESYLNPLEEVIFTHCHHSEIGIRKCGEYQYLVEELEPKLERLAEIIKDSFSEFERENVMRELQYMIENKFYEAKSEKSKFLIAYVRIWLQDLVIEEDADEITSRIWEKILSFKKTWGIVAYNEMPGDRTIFWDDTLISFNNLFDISVAAYFDSGEVITWESGHQVIAYFGEMWEEIYRDNMVYGYFDEAIQEWRVEKTTWRIPDEKIVTFYLLCSYCDAPVFHPDWDSQKVIEQQSFPFEKANDDILHDVVVEMLDIQKTPTQIDVTYEVSNAGVENVGEVRVWSWIDQHNYEWYYDDGPLDLTLKVKDVDCPWLPSYSVTQDEIYLEKFDACTITQSFYYQDKPWYEVSISIEVDAEIDQDWDNNYINRIYREE